MVRSRFLRHKLVVVGGPGVGKSLLRHRFVQTLLTDEYDPEIEDSCHKQCVVDDSLTLLDVLDTTKLEENQANRDWYMSYGEGFVCVYSITSRESFEQCQTLCQQILINKNQHHFPMIVVANKCDLETQRQISMQEGFELAKQFACRFVEVSIDQKSEIDQAFFDLVRTIRYYDQDRFYPQQPQLLRAKVSKLVSKAQLHGSTMLTKFIHKTTKANNHFSDVISK